MARVRARLVAALAVAATGFTVLGAAPAQAASRDTIAERAIAAQTGRSAEQLTGDRTIDGVRIGKATHGRQDLTTYVQDQSDGYAVIAVLDDGQESATFDGLLKPGQRLEPNAAGGLAILDGNNMVGHIEAPWARDAEGKSLPTSYKVEGTSVVQEVDTTGATFPVVADPYVKTGYYIVPVSYVQYTWSETWWVKNHLGASAISYALLCSQTGAAAPFCAYFGAMFFWDVNNVVNTAIANKRCLKMRVPLTMGAIGVPAYDSYYVTCSS